MMNFAEYAAHDATGLAELVRKRQVSPRELVETVLAAIAKLNPRLNAVTRTFPEVAEAAIAAGLPEGPFTGVPLLTKELVPHAAGIRCDGGSRLAQGLITHHDSTLMARFRAAGFVHTGGTQSPELGYCPTTENILFGPVRNPWDTTRSAGGSSGGAGALRGVRHRSARPCQRWRRLDPHPRLLRRPGRPEAVARPDSLGRLHATRCAASRWNSPLTRSVRDVAAVLDAVAGADPGAPGVRRGRPNQFADASRRSRPAACGLPGRHPASGAAADPDCVAAVQRRRARCWRILGHDVQEARPAARLGGVPREHPRHLDRQHRHLRRRAGGRPPAANRGRTRWRRLTLACYEDGKRYSAVDLLTALAYGNLVSRQVGAWFENGGRVRHPHHRPPARQAGRARPEPRRAERAGLDRTGVRLLPVHPPV